MEKILIMSAYILVLNSPVYGQEEKLEVQGALQISNSEDPTPDAGTVQWTGSDLEVYNGMSWVSLTADNKFVKDIETNKYDIVTIGAQVWMAENLRVTRYNDGTPIDLITLDAGWATIFFPAYTWYDNSASDYGALYNYYVVADTNSRNVCPTGWHVPSEAEWMNLTNFLGGISVAGGKMKESGLAHWNEPNSAATNVSGFTGLPGGFRSKSGSFFALGDKGSWWSSTGGSGEFAKLTEIFHDGETVSHTNLEKKSGYSVRCLRD